MREGDAKGGYCRRREERSVGEEMKSDGREEMGKRREGGGLMGGEVKLSNRK